MEVINEVSGDNWADLVPGRVFIWQGEVYMKIKEHRCSSITTNAVSVIDGGHMYFGGTLGVRPVKAVLTIS